MAKCFITGVEISLEKSYLIDIAATHYAVHQLRQRVRSLESLLQQLGTRDEREVYRREEGKRKLIMQRRVICEEAAELIAKVYPSQELFIRWPEYRRKKEEFYSKIRKIEGGE